MSKTQQFLPGLGIVGWGALEPVLLAALATEAPLLLVGPHGTAKSLLLERLAEALGLRFRHYNASILNFDDLCGFPVPDGDRVRYLRTPLDAWDAEAIFIDEVSRCRPDLQNRLFPLVHERRLQGERLTHLRFRWSAMNPPPPPDADPDDDCYLGAEPLDPAFADRFPWVIQVPDALGVKDRRALIRGPARDPDAGEQLAAAVAEVRGRLALTEQTHGEMAAAYTDVAALALARGKLPLSNRRLRFLYQGILAVIATGRTDTAADAARLALTWSIPQRASRPVDDMVVLRAHTAARAIIKAPRDNLRRALLAEADPVARVGLALDSSDDDLLAATVLDARAGIPPAHRLALSVRLFPLLAETRPELPGVLFEALAEDVARTSSLQETIESVATASRKYKLANEVARACAELKDEEQWITDVLWAAVRDDLTLDVARAVAFCRSLARVLPTLQEALAGIERVA